MLQSSTTVRRVQEDRTKDPRIYSRYIYIYVEVGEGFGHDGETKERKVGAWGGMKWGYGGHEG